MKDPFEAIGPISQFAMRGCYDRDSKLLWHFAMFLKPILPEVLL